MGLNPKNIPQQIIRLAFASVKGMNPLFARHLLSKIGSERQFFTLSEKTLSSLLSLNSPILADGYRNDLLEKASKENDFIVANSIQPLFLDEEDYPQLLAECDDAPMVLHSLGQHNCNNGYLLSVVGTRHATPYGINFTERIIAELAEKVDRPVTIVSGLAFGIDVAAHNAAMKYGLPTIAVLAHGLNTIYPAQHRSIASNIIKSGGLLVTEYSSSDAIHKGNFLARNRIVAGLSHALLVVESAEKGGALITARIASDYQRDVFALPGRISDIYSRGCNNLISNHVAQLIQNADDIISAMRWQTKSAKPVQKEMFAEPLSPNEQAIIQYLTANGEASINQLSVKCNIPVGKLTAILIDMELRGLILKFPGARYRLA